MINDDKFWRGIDSKYKYAAKDKDNSWQVFTHKPCIVPGDYWALIPISNEEYDCIEVDSVPQEWNGVHWENSIKRRNQRPFSPCQGCCTTALGDDVCQNCCRTSDEVDNWNFMTPEERDEVWDRLEQEQENPLIRR